MSSQRVNLTTATPSQAGRISTIKLVSQSVTGPPGADGAGVSVALKEGGTTRVAVATVIDFQAGFDVDTSGLVTLDLTEYGGGALPVAGGGTGATSAGAALTALGAAASATTISTTAPLTGGGDLSANRTLAVSAASDTASGVVELATTAETQTGTDTARAVTPAGFAAGLAKQPEFMIIAVGDETTAITTGTAKVTWRMPFAFTVTAVRASLATASSSGNPAIDINEGGASIFSTTLTIDANELTSTTAATACVISDAAIADDALMTIDIDTAGTGAKGLKVCIYGTRA